MGLLLNYETLQDRHLGMHLSGCGLWLCGGISLHLMGSKARMMIISDEDRSTKEDKTDEPNY